MHYLLLQSLLNILQTRDLKYTVNFWMQVKLSTRYCIMVFSRNWWRKMSQLHLFGSLYNWYNNSHCSVRWNNVIGESFVEFVREGFFPISICSVRGWVDNSAKKFQLWFTYWSTVLGCAFYADDIALLSVSCYGFQRLINICEQYGTAWDIRFNPTKSQLITFGGPNPSVCGIHINGKPIH